MGALELIKLWVAIRPFKRLKERRESKRAAAAAENQVSENVPLEAAPAAEDDGMSELTKSIIRSVLKTLGAAVVTWAVTKGYLGADQSAGMVTAIETIAGGASVALGMLWSHRTHKV